MDIMGNCICALTVVGCVILLIRKVWGRYLYPQVTTSLWILFFVVALFPFKAVDHGMTLLEYNKPYGELDFSVVKIETGYEESIDTEYETDLIAQYRTKDAIEKVLAVVWVVGMFAAFSYKLYVRLRLQRTIKQDVLYKLSENMQQENNVYLKYPTYIMENYGPFVHGIRPSIYVPESILTDSNLFRTAVLHEQEHIKRKHHLILLLMDIVSSIYWFLPYVDKLFFQALREDMEFRCDYELIKRGDIEAREYVADLVSFADGSKKMQGELAFGKGHLKRRVSYLLQKGKDRKKTMYALGVMFVLVLIFVARVGHYYKEDVQGFTKREVREARDVLLEYYGLSNKGDYEEMKKYISPSSGQYAGMLSGKSNYSTRQIVIHNISYEPDSIQYYYAEKHVMKNGLNPDDCIYFQGDITYSGLYVNGEYFEEYLPKYGFTLVRPENGKWQYYGSGY